MSTRACYGFSDSSGTFWVYGHYDGYPEGAAQYIRNVFTSGTSWQLPRFEPGEFTAAFIAANKQSGGNLYLSHGPECHHDIEWVYLISQPAERDALQITVTKMHGRTFSCLLGDFLSPKLKPAESA
jgi:hypothetical protein